MKNRKTAKLLIMVLSLALLIGSAVGIAASAENAAPEIISQNVEYSGTLNFKFAISAENLGADKTVTVNIYDKNPDEDGAVLLDSTTAAYEDVSDTNLGVQYAYVATSKAAISALNYGTEYYAQAVCDDVAGEAVKYSAVEYFLTRLYREGEVVTDIQREHYENVLAYGSTTQKITGDTGTNVADYRYVAAKGGNIVVGGNTLGSSAILVKDTAFTIQPTEAVASGYVAIWKDAAGVSYQPGKEMTASASTTFTSTLIPMLTFDGMDGVTPNVKTNTSVSSASQVFTTFGDDYAVYNNIFKIYNGVLEKNMPTASIVDGKLAVTSDDGSDYIKIYPTTTESGYNHSVFEADLTFNCSGNIGFDLLQSDNSTAVRFSNFTYNMSTGYFKMNATNTSGGTGSTVDIYLPTTGDNAHTLNLKVDHYKVNYDTESGTYKDIVVAFYFNGTLKYIIDSRLATDETASNIDSKNTDGVLLSGTRYYPYSNSTAGKEAVKTDFSQFSLNPNSNFSGTISFDNISFIQNVFEGEPDYNTTLK